MMNLMQNETSDKQEDIVYVYIRKFIYKDKNSESRTDGQPFENRVYRAFYNKLSKEYRIVFEEETSGGLKGLILKNLISSDSKWESDIAIVDSEILLNYDIQPEDFQKLALWKESNNSDIEHLRIDSDSAYTQQKVDSSNNVENLRPVSLKQPTASDILKSIEEKDPALSNAIMNFLYGCDIYSSMINSDIADATLPLTKSPIYGKFANVAIVLDSLDGYLRLSEHETDPSNLRKSIYYLFRELSRIER